MLAVMSSVLAVSGQNPESLDHQLQTPLNLVLKDPCILCRIDIPLMYASVLDMTCPNSQIPSTRVTD